MNTELIGYVSVAEADEYISSNFFSSDKRRKAWDRLIEDEKKICLRNGLLDLNAYINFNITDDILNDVKSAQIEESIWYLGDTSAMEDMENNIVQQTIGSISINIGRYINTFISKVYNVLFSNACVDLFCNNKKNKLINGKLLKYIAVRINASLSFLSKFLNNCVVLHYRICI